MNGSTLTMDELEIAVLERDAAGSAVVRRALDVGSGEIMQLASDCCGSNNYPEQQG